LFSQTAIINNYNSTILSQTCITGRDNFKKLNANTTLTGIYFELRGGCSTWYKLLFIMNAINTILITSICGIQALMIVFKFSYYFLSERLPEEAYATMSDKKVVVHSL